MKDLRAVKQGAPRADGCVSLVTGWKLSDRSCVQILVFTKSASLLQPSQPPSSSGSVMWRPREKMRIRGWWKCWDREEGDRILRRVAQASFTRSISAARLGGSRRNLHRDQWHFEESHSKKRRVFSSISSSWSKIKILNRPSPTLHRYWHLMWQMGALFIPQVRPWPLRPYSHTAGYSYKSVRRLSFITKLCRILIG